MALSYPEDDLTSLLASLTTSLPESTRCRHQLRALGGRRQATDKLREDWLAHTQRPYTVYYPLPSGLSLSAHTQNPLQGPAQEEDDFNLATLHTTLSTSPISTTHKKRAISTTIRRSDIEQPNGSFGRLLFGGRHAGAKTPAVRATFSVRAAAAERSKSPIIDALNRPFVPLPHLLDSPPGTALYRERTDVSLWKDEIEKCVPARLPLAVRTVLTPPAPADLSEGEYLGVPGPVFYHAERAAPPRQYVIHREWFSERASLKQARGHRSNRLVFGWTK